MRPLTRAVLLLAAGIAVGLRAPLPGPALLLPLAAALALPAVLRAGAAPAWIAAGAVLLGGIALGATGSAASRADCRARFPDGAPLVVRGAFAAEPGAGGAAPFLLEAVRVAGARRACRGEVRARLPAPRGRAGAAGAPPPAAGAEVVGWGRWWAFPAEGPWPRPPERAGVLSFDSVRVLAPGAGHHPLMALRGTVQRRIRELFPRRAAIAEAVLVARTEGLDPAVRERFARAGLSHLLAISGFHVGLVAAALLLLARLARLPTDAASIAAAGATGAYVLFLGAPAAASRAAIQLLFLLLSRLLQRPADPFSLLAAAAAILLASDPLALLQPGFQLSFAGVAGLILLRRRLLDRLPTLPGPAGRAAREALAAGVAAAAATAPIAAWHFGRFAPGGVLANLVAVPVASAAVPALALTLAAHAAVPPLGRFLAPGADLLLAALDRAAALGAAIPGGHAWVPRDAAWAWTLAAALAALLLARLRPAAAAAARRPARLARAAVAAGAAAALLLLWTPAVRHARGGDLEIHAIDVGQGDALAIRSPAGRWILVDAGPRSDRYDAGRARVVPFLLRNGARRVEALVLTHPDADHIGGAAAVFEALDVGTVVDPGLAAGKPLYLELLRLAREEGSRWIVARPGRELRMDGMIIRFLYPTAGTAASAAEANDASVVFLLEWGGFRALFTGDAPAAAERELVDRYGPEIRARLLKVGHHGSATSTTGALLAAVRPELALVSVGRRNRYGHPNPAVIRRLERHGVRVLRTDRHGTVTVRVQAGGALSVDTAR